MRHDEIMLPDLHLDPERLGVHAAVAAALSELLLVPAPPGVPVPAAVAAELERLHAAAGRAAHELAALAAALAAVAAAAREGDDRAARALGRPADGR